jgi:hypothetical protein
MTLREKYAAVMFNGLRPNDSDIVESVAPVGFLVALLYEMLEENLIELEDEMVTTKKSADDAKGDKKVVLDIIITRGETLKFGDLVKYLFFSVNCAYIKAILSETEKEMVSSSYIVKEEKKSFFKKKTVYRTHEEVLAKLSREICEFSDYKDFLLAYLLKKCCLLEYVVPKKNLKAAKKAIEENERAKDSFIITVNQVISSISSTLATSGIMM